MQTNILKCHALAPMPEVSGAELPTDIQVFPPGKGVEFTLQDHPGETFAMDVDETVAVKAQSDLAHLLARANAGQGPKPFADKNHEDSEATFHPKRFYWAGNDPKSGGVRVETVWTGFGAALVRARAMSYFSANFLFNKTAKKFLGLINENIGGLVNRPGFAAQQAFAKASPASIVDLDLRAEIKRLNATYGVSMPLDEEYPLVAAAQQLSKRNGTNWFLEFNKLVLQEPELYRHQQFLDTGVDPQKNLELRQEIVSLRTEAEKKADAEAMLASAKAYQRATGLPFDQAWNQVRTAKLAATKDERIAAAVYQRALEIRYSDGLTFVEAHARATTEFSGGPKVATAPSEHRRNAAHAFQTHARAFADAIRPGMDQQEAERCFASSDVGRWMYEQCR